MEGTYVKYRTLCLECVKGQLTGGVNVSIILGFMFIENDCLASLWLFEYLDYS